MGESARSIGAWSLLGTPPAANALAATGADWVVLDEQHGLWDARSTADALSLLTCSTTTCAPWVRTASGDPALIGRALDGGAHGVIVPMVEDVSAARSAASATRYPPQGTRSWGPMAAYRGQPTPSPAQANAEVTCAIMIETAKALVQADQLAAVDGVDMLFVGPFDLSIALGLELDELLALDGEEDPLPRIARAGREAGVRLGAFAGSVETAAALGRHGFDWLAVAVDAALVVAGRSVVAAARDA